MNTHPLPHRCISTSRSSLVLDPCGEESPSPSGDPTLASARKTSKESPWPGSPASIRRRSTLFPRGNTIHTLMYLCKCINSWTQCSGTFTKKVFFFLFYFWIPYQLRIALPFLGVTRVYNLFSSLCHCIDPQVSRCKLTQKENHSLKRKIPVGGELQVF